MLISPALTGFGTGLSLIVAIGAQNAYILRQGITRQHVWVAVALCAISDALLIAAGIAGIGALIERAAWILPIARIGGAVFLASYAIFALRRALKPSFISAGQNPASSSLARVILTTLALTWLNPHVYLDTVLLLGSIGNSFGTDRWIFAMGAIGASLVWFSALGAASGMLSKVFSNPRAWQVLDLVICIFMCYLAIGLARPLF